jgi:signal transduction histidine kinase
MNAECANISSGVRHENPDSANSLNQTDVDRGEGGAVTRETALTSSNADDHPVHLQTCLGRLKEPGWSRYQDGRHLARECLATANLSAFPPKLFVLWLTIAHEPYEEVLKGIHSVLQELELDHVPVIGASAAACMFDWDAHERGAVLVSLGSRFVEVRPAVVDDAITNPSGAVRSLLDQLDIRGTRGVNSWGNQFLITFLPGDAENRDLLQYRTVDIFEALRKQTYGKLRMFGGGASGGLSGGVGRQFFNQQVFSSGAAVALVSANVAYGIGLKHGLARSGKFIHVEETKDKGRVITSVQECSPQHVLTQVMLTKNDVLGLETNVGDQVIYVPRLVGDQLQVQRALPKKATLEVMTPDAKRMLASVKEMEKWLLRSFRAQRENATCILAIGCRGRYRVRDEIGFEVREALKSVRKRFPRCLHVGAFMDGEIGLDRDGRPVISNWSLSEAVFTDHVSTKAAQRLALAAIQKWTEKATTACSVKLAMESCLSCVEDAGYAGGMISLVMDDGDKKWIVAQATKGGLWGKEIAPRTRRELSGDDILAVVAREGPKFVANARTDPSCDNKAARIGGVVSFYAYSLRDEKGDPIGTLQIQLEDMRNVADLPEDRKSVLNALGAMAAGAINRAIKTEELNLSRKLDDIFSESQKYDTEQDACGSFVTRAVKDLGVHVIVRLLDGSTNKLILVAGERSDYYDLAERVRKEVGLDDLGPSARCFSKGTHIVVNDTESNLEYQQFLATLASAEVRDRAKEIGSYACYPIEMLPKGEMAERDRNGTPDGTVFFASREKHFFTESLKKSLQDIGKRLSQLLAHVREKEKVILRSVELEFLARIAPPLHEKLNLHFALRNHVENVRKACKADVVCCYLWDDMRKRYVLRAASGWKDGRWLDAAWYALGEGYTGKLAGKKTPTYIPDLKQSKTGSPPQSGKYVQEMFGGPIEEGFTCELIVLPLRFKKERLGVVTLYHKTRQPVVPKKSRFAKIHPVLEQAADIHAAFVAALQEHDLTAWEKEDFRRREAVVKMLYKPGNQSLESLLSAFSEAVIEQYQFRHVAVHLEDDDRHLKQHKLAQRSDRLLSTDDPLREQFKNAVIKAYTSGKTDPVFSPPAEDHRNPKQAKIEKLVTGICVPLIIDGSPVGVLELGWHGLRPSHDPIILPHHSQAALEELGTRLASAIKSLLLEAERRHSRLRAECARQALDGIAQNLLENFHELSKGVQAVSANLNRLERSCSTTAQMDLVKKAQGWIRKLVHLFEKVVAAGERLATVNRSRSPVNKLLQEALSDLRPIAREANVRIQEDIHEFEADVNGVQILECFKNVIENAIKATPNGGSLKIVCRQANEKEWIFTCQDAGAGLTGEELARIRAGKPIQTDSGYGVGLFLTGRYCEAHRGRVEIHSSPGAGTRIEMRIPLKDTWD